MGFLRRRACFLAGQTEPDPGTGTSFCGRGPPTPGHVALPLPGISRFFLGSRLQAPALCWEAGGRVLYWEFTRSLRDPGRFLHLSVGLPLQILSFVNSR